MSLRDCGPPTYTLIGAMCETGFNVSRSICVDDLSLVVPAEFVCKVYDSDFDDGRSEIVSVL